MNTTVNATKYAIAKKSAIATACDTAVERNKQALNTNQTCSLVELSEKFEGIYPVNIYKKDIGGSFTQQSCVDISETSGLTFFPRYDNSLCI